MPNTVRVKGDSAVVEIRERGEEDLRMPLTAVTYNMFEEIKLHPQPSNEIQQRVATSRC